MGEVQQSIGVGARLGRWLERNRGLVVVTVVLPLSLVFGVLVWCKRALHRYMAAGPEHHQRRVALVQKQVS